MKNFSTPFVDKFIFENQKSNLKKYIFAQMKLITSHIEYLLADNDCVIVPGFGGFVNQNLAAQFNEAEVLPPAREICFNAELKHDDGLLINSISRVLGVSYNDARRMMQNELDLFASDVAYQKRYEMGRVGSFSKDENGNLVFESFVEVTKDVHSFGLTSVKMLHLNDLPQREEFSKPDVKSDPDIIHIRFSKRKALRSIASVAAVLVLWLISSAPLTDTSRKSEYAGFITRNSIIKVVEKSSVVAPVDTVQQTKPEVSEPAAETVAKSEIKPEIKEVSLVDRYFVVLGSFQSETSANRHLEQLTEAGIRDVKVMKLGKLMRTTLRGFSEKEAAEKYLQSIRYSNEAFNEAWLYCKK